MKTTKLILIAAILAITSVGFAQTKSSPAFSQATPDRPHFSVLINLPNALHNSGLVRAMYSQLDPNFLTVEKPTYTVVVKYRNNVYYITGTYGQWKRFFRMSPNDTPPES